MAIKYTKNTGDAEDLLHDTIMKAYLNFDKYESGTNCKAWLFKILTNAFINKYRKSLKEQTFLDDQDENRIESIPAPIPSDIHAIQSTELENIKNTVGDEVFNALKKIPQDFRDVIIYADLLDYSYKEIADLMDCPIGTIMSRLFRGRKILQKSLSNYAQNYGYMTSAA